MKKSKIILAFLFCFLGQVHAQSFTSSDYVGIRKAIVQAVDSERLTDSLLQKLIPFSDNNPLLMGYVATLQALKSKHHWNPYLKLKYLQLATKKMNKAVASAPMNLEIRFMRFSIQHYTPSFLGYSKQLAEDRQVLVKLYDTQNFGTADALFVKSIAQFMLETKRCTEAEKQIFKKFA
jgi:hypothetical protein